MGRMAQLTIDYDAADLVEGKTDSRGRLCLGPDHADSEVEVVVVESREPEAKTAD